MKTDPIKDLQLIQESLNGHPEAFRDLMALYQDYIYDLAYRMTRSPEDAEDIAQETFLRIWRNLHRYKPQHRFSAWAYTICLNLCRKRLKRQRWIFWRRAADPEDLPIPEPIDPSPLSDPQKSLETKARTGQIQELAKRCINSLSPSLREPFVLCYLHNLSYEEISRATGLSLNAVRMRLHRARHDLFEQFQESFHETFPEPEGIVE